MLGIDQQTIARKLDNLPVPRDTHFTFNQYLQFSATLFIFIFALADFGNLYNGGKTYVKDVKQFSYHAYEHNNHGAFHGPFLGQVRLTSDSTPVGYATELTNSMKQSICVRSNGIVNITATNNATAYVPFTGDKAILLDKCKMMRTPDLLLGQVHSSWSVLGTQSIFNLTKHIVFILIVFILFSWIENQVNVTGKENNYFLSHSAWMRSLTIIFAIVLFFINILLDYQNDLYAVDDNHRNKHAIGSITTGASFCLVTILIICLNHLDEPEKTETNTDNKPIREDPRPQATDKNDSPIGQPQDGVTTVNYGMIPQRMYGIETHGNNFEKRQVGIPGFFDFQLIKDDLGWTKPSQSFTYIAHSENFKRFAAMYRNIHDSYLMLLLFPLVWILALVRTGRVIVDVHVQLIFFSIIFFAVLDIIQIRVSSVLASFEKPADVSAIYKDSIFKIQIFVVVAFLLAKAFVFIPVVQLTVLYYLQSRTLELGLVIVQLILVGLSVFVDIACSTLLIDMDKIVDIRKIMFWAYWFSLTCCLIAV